MQAIVTYIVIQKQNRCHISLYVVPLMPAFVDLSYFLLFFSFSHSLCSVGSCVYKGSWKLRSTRTATTGAPLSHRKHYSWNASCAGSLSLCDFLTAWYIVISHLFIIYAYSHGTSKANPKLKTWQSRPETWRVWLAQVCLRWPITAGWVFGGGLKETGAKTEHSVEVNTVLQHWTIWEYGCSHTV